MLQYYCNMKERVREKPIEIRMLGYEVVEKTAKQCATSATRSEELGWKTRKDCEVGSMKNYDTKIGDFTSNVLSGLVEKDDS